MLLSRFFWECNANNLTIWKNFIMDLTLLHNFLINIPVSAMMDTFTVLTFFLLLGEKWRLKRLLKIIGIMIVITSAYTTILFQCGLRQLPFYIGEIVNLYIYMLVVMVLIRYVLKYDRDTSVIIGGLSVFIQWNVSVVADIFEPFGMDVTTTAGICLYLIIYMVIFPVFALAVIFLIKKLRFPYFIQHMLTVKQNRKLLVWIVGISPLLLYVPEYLFERYKEWLWNILSPLAALLLLTILGLCSYMASSEIRREKIREQERLLVQQNIYIRNMEEMQKEVRAFRHDYKNILAGLYLHAQENDRDELLEQLSHLTDTFDQGLGHCIWQYNQLANIQVTEIKGLILVKLFKMQQLGMECHLEVPYPFVAVDLDLITLNRCLGILIDNAIEEVENHEKPEMDILINVQSDGVLFVIRNEVCNDMGENMQIFDIWKEGYSTKGNNRGMGLASYKRILEQNENLLSSTYCEKGFFTQELKVMKKS